MSIPLQPRQWSQGGKAGQSSPAKLKTVPIHRIDSSQAYVDGAKVERMAKAMKKGKEMPAPVVSYTNGRYTVHDGHNRLAAAKANGERSIKVAIY